MIKPILFNTEMVQAIMRGDKTVSRRVVKPQPAHNAVIVPSPSPWYGWENATDMWHIKPPYKPGDIMYVRETWGIAFSYGTHGVGKTGFYVYRADGNELAPTLSGKWRPSIHMPKEAARIFLRVTDVRVERLQDSFTAQGTAIIALQSEGIDIGDHCRQCIQNYRYPCCNDLDPELEFNEDIGEDESGGSECGMLDGVRYEFSCLWDSTIKPADLPAYGWNANPWVWIIEFEQISREECHESP